MTAATIRLRGLRALLGHARAIGMDVVAMLARVGIEPRAIMDSDQQARPQTIYALWKQVERFAPDPLLGLHVVDNIDFALLEYMPEYPLPQHFFASETLGAGLARVARMFPSTYGAARLDISRMRGRVTVRLELSEPDAPSPHVEFLLAMLHRLCTHAIAGAPPTIAVRFSHPAPPSTAAHEAWFRAPVSFGAAASSLELSEASLALPLRTANAKRLAELDAAAGTDEAPVVTAAVTLRQRVLDTIAAHLDRHPPSLDVVARHLGLTVRTLTRKLRDEDTSYRALLDEARARVAGQLLLESTRPLKEVAQLVGFSEPSAFHRAFQRWYGNNPTTFRNQRGLAHSANTWPKQRLSRRRDRS
jgi:AraC-like DNA-binding protein